MTIHSPNEFSFTETITWFTLIKLHWRKYLKTLVYIPLLAGCTEEIKAVSSTWSIPTHRNPVWPSQRDSPHLSVLQGGVLFHMAHPSDQAVQAALLTRRMPTPPFYSALRSKHELKIGFNLS